MTDPLSALIAVIPSLAKAGAEIAASSDAAKRNAQLIEFQNVVIQLQAGLASVQIQNASLLRDKDELEKQLVRFKNWEGEKQRYALVNILEGTGVAFALKESMSNGEAAHWLCANCFNNEKKSVLNRVEGSRGFSMLACTVCKAQIQSSYRGSLTASYAPGHS